MSDIFREVDEEVRRERLKQLWDRYGNVIVAVALILVVGIGGWRAYQWWEAKKAAESGAEFEAAIALSDQGKHAEAAATFAKIARNGTGGYRVLARFHEAEELETSDAQAAVKAYDALAADTGIGAAMQDLAAVRAGLILADTAPYEELRSRLEPISGGGRAFRHTAREILALAAWRTNDRAAARHWIDTIMADPGTPAAVRSRVEVLMALTGPDATG